MQRQIKLTPPAFACRFRVKSVSRGPYAKTQRQRRQQRGRHCKTQVHIICEKKGRLKNVF